MLPRADSSRCLGWRRGVRGLFAVRGFLCTCTGWNGSAQESYQARKSTQYVFNISKSVCLQHAFSSWRKENGIKKSTNFHIRKCQIVLVCLFFIITSFLNWGSLQTLSIMSVAGMTLQLGATVLIIFSALTMTGWGRMLSKIWYHVKQKQQSVVRGEKIKF